MDVGDDRRSKAEAETNGVSPGGGSPPWRRVRSALFVGLGAVLGALIIVILAARSGQPRIIRVVNRVLPRLLHAQHADCTGHGLRLSNGFCVCDLGWRGPACATAYDVSRASGRVRERTVLMVVEHFSPVDLERDNAIYYTTLAGYLVRTGYTVSVLVVGPPSTNFEQLRRLYAGKKIELLRLPTWDLRFEGSKITGISHQTMRYIVEEAAARGGPWELLLMLGGRGVAYHTLLAQRQGLLCIGSHVVVGLDSLTPLRRGQLQRGSKTAIVPEHDALAADWMQQRATEMADTLVVSSKALLDYAVEMGWRVPEHVYILPYLTVPVANEKSEIERAEELIPARQTQVKEFVFVGPLGVVGGLGVMLNAVDNILSRDQKAHRKLLKDRQLRVTFYGWNDVANEEGDLTGEHYIEMRSYAWGNRVKYHVAHDMHLKKVIRYLTESGKGRVAVVPAVGDSSAFLLHQALRAGVPVLASNLKSAQELVHIQDRRDVLFAANDTVALAKRMLDVFNNGVLLGRPQVAVKQYEAQWRQLLADVHARPLPPCPSEGFSLASLRGEGTTLMGEDVSLGGVPNPLVTVVITHHNRHKLLQQAITSIEGQTLRDLEVILVDDGSTDAEALKFLSDLGWRWWQERAWKVLREPNRYLGAARNTGARLARGKYILFMDDDDIAKPAQVETMLRVAEISGADVVTTGHDLFSGRSPPGPKSALARYVPLGGALNAGVLRNVFGDSNMLVHRQFFLDMGGFTEEYGVGYEDYEFLAKVVARDNHLEALAEPQHWYRQHPGTMSEQTDRKAGQVRYLRAFVEVFPYLPKLTQGLLRYIQGLYFHVDQGPSLKYALANTTTTTTTTTTSTTVTTIPVTSTTVTTVSSTPTTIFTTSTTIASTVVSSDTTFITSTLSRQTFITSLMTPGGTCPCRSHRRPRTTISSSSLRSTCTSTATITPTVRRTGRATTVTVTYTPTLTCNADLSQLEPVPVPRFLAVGVDGSRLFIDMEQATMVAETRTVFVDAPPARAPMALTAEYSAGGEYVLVLFDRPVNVELGRRFRCDVFLNVHAQDVPNAAILARRPEDCHLYFASPTEMRVRVDPRFARREKHGLQPGKLLVFREGTLSNVDSLNRAFVSGSIEVAPPSDPDPPTIVVDAPAVVGACDEYLRLDLSRSVGAAGRPFIDAHFDFNSTASDNYFMDSPLRQFLHSAAMEVIKTGRLVVDVPSSLLTDYTAYTFHLSLWNVFGVGATGYTTVSKVANSNVPAVAIEGPARLRQDEAVQFVALLPGEVCGHGYNATVAWRIVSGPSRPRIRGANRAALVFAAQAFEPGDYVLGLRVTVSMDQSDAEDLHYHPASGSVYVFSHAFAVLPVEARMEIAGGSRLIGREDSTRLLVKILGEGSPDEFAYQWRCLAADRESPCELADGSEWRVREDAVPHALYIHGREWTPGQDMEFIVTATHRHFGYVLRDAVVVAVARAATVPRVELAIDRTTITTHERTLGMVARVARPSDATQPRNHTFYWESLPYCNRQFYAVAPDFSTPAHHVHWTSESANATKVEPAALLPGAEYCFRVAVLDGTSERVGWAFRTVRVREPPTGGYCEMTSAAVGVAFEHRFTVACHGWSGPNLRYRFKTRMRGDAIPLAPATSMSQLTFTTDVGHYLVEVDILDGDDLMTTVAVRNISARVGATRKDTYLAHQLARFEKSKNPRLGYQILSLTAANLVPSILAGQSPAKTAKPGAASMAMAARHGNVTLSRVLQVVDTLTQSTAIDAEESGPYFLDYLQRILPNKLPIDLRPLLLRILLRITHGMSEDRVATEDCFAPEHVMQILRLLGPIYQNPRGGASASFIVHEIKNALETCIQRTLYCDVPEEHGEGVAQSSTESASSPSASGASTMSSPSRRRPSEPTRPAEGTIVAMRKAKKMCHQLLANDAQPSEGEDHMEERWKGEPFTWGGEKQTIEFGLVDTRDLVTSTRLCGFTLPDLRGMTTPDFPCLGYRCAFTKANLMRNNSIDHYVLELSFRNATQILAPWFRTRHVTFLMPLSPDFQRRLEHGGRPKCVWYDRFMNATASYWSDEGCRVLGYNTSHVQCACSHLTEFSVMIPPSRVIISSWWKYLLLGGMLGVALAGAVYYVERRRRSGSGSGRRSWRDWLMPWRAGRTAHSASTIQVAKSGRGSRKLSRSTIIATAKYDDSQASISTIAAPRVRRSAESSHLLQRRQSAQPPRPAAASPAELRRTHSQVLWTRRDEEALRQERISQILRDLESEDS